MSVSKKVKTAGTLRQRECGRTTVRTCVCPLKHYLQVLPRHVPPTLLAVNPSLINTAQYMYLWPVCHNAPSSLFVFALITNSCCFRQNYSSSAFLLLSVSLSCSLFEEAAVGLGVVTLSGSWVWGVEMSIRLKVWIALRCLAASFGS